MLSFCVMGCKDSVDSQPLDMSERLITIASGSTSEDIARDVVYAIVGIETESSIGSGVCVEREGYVVTNSHVVSGKDSIYLHLYNGDVISSTLVYDDPVLDIAILRASQPLPYLALSNIDSVVGEDVLAVGTPLSLSLSHSFTKGIVSAVGRTIPMSSDSGIYYMSGLIQHDASLNSGNSGGPLLNQRGEVVGINTLKIAGGDGVGFSIPSKAFSSVLSSILSDSDYSLPYLGVFGCDAAIELGVDNPGFLVKSVSPTSPASSIIEESAIITKISGVTVTSYMDFRHEMYKFAAYDKVAISYTLDGVENDVIVTLGKK